MEFLIDAYLPRKLTNIFMNKDLKAMHTIDLPNANTTTENMASVYQKCACLLGEGILKTKEHLLWLDVSERKLYIKNDHTGGLAIHALPKQASAIWKLDNQLIYLLTNKGICTFDMESNEWNISVAIPLKEKLPKDIRTNDGGMLGDNYYIYGSMQRNPKELAGSIYLTDGLTINKISSKIGIPNSFIQTGDSELLISDSFEQIVYKYKFDLNAKNLAKKSIWLDLSKEKHTPDGGCIDQNGYIFICMWDGNCVNKYDAKANLIESFRLPIPRPTNCVLSLDKKTLYITSAREGLSKKQLELYPESGDVFQIKVNYEHTS